jgi:hypothetical protein
MIGVNFIKLVAALIIIESGGDDSAIGDKGKAVGCLQIHPVMVNDCNRILAQRGSETVYTQADRWDRAKSIAMCRLFIEHYCIKTRIGRAPTMEDAARMWNGGPNGWRYTSTENYWEKVKEVLEK